jgi:alginate O-acetyltransferase complex protein AlgI
MVFSSLLFLFVFLPVVTGLYFVTPRKWRNLLLFVASLIFYGWGEPVYITIMLFSTVLDYCCGWAAGHFNSIGKNGRARIAVAVSVVINLALLMTFKYTDFIVGNLNQVFGLAIPLAHLPLPIGISFYTFQTMSYTLDVYRGEAPVQKNIVSFGAYVTLFPQLIAGPIVRYQTIAEEMQNRTVNAAEIASGTRRFVIGLAKKVLLANNIGLIWSQVKGLDPAHIPALTAWLGIIAFAFQIYFDFSAYSDMAIGMGRIFGFHFLENFNYPYMADSITDFWRRWHISCGTWFREYVYIPLGGNRRGLAMQLRNIMIVWMLTGIWHGASWNFLLWGLYFGIFLTLEKFVFKSLLDRLQLVWRRFYTLLVVVISWVLFEFTALPHGLAFLRSMFGFSQAGLFDNQSLYLMYTNLALFAVAIVGSTNLPRRLCQKWLAMAGGWRRLAGVMEPVAMTVLVLLSTAFLVDSSYNPFLYFRF